MSMTPTPTPTLSAEDELCLKALLRLGDEDGGDRFLHEAEEVAALTGLDEWYTVKPALDRLADLGGAVAYDTDKMPRRYQVWRPIATELLGVEEDFAVTLPLVPDPRPRARLSDLAARR